MKKIGFFGYIIYAALALAGSVLCSGCSDEEDVLPNQQRQILSFLTGTLRLRSEAEAFDPSSEMENPPFYTTSGETAYRWITNYYDADRDQRPLVMPGSRVRLTLSIYLFDYRAITDRTVPLYTNDTRLKASLEEAGLDSEWWPFEPYVLTVGETPTISGLESSLVGCRAGDIVQVYMTYTMAYGGKSWLYTVEPESPLAIHYTVDYVE